MTLLGTERLETPVVEDQELDAAEGTHQARVTAVAACQREIAEYASGPVNQVVAEAASQQLPATPATNSARISAARAMSRPCPRPLIIEP